MHLATLLETSAAAYANCLKDCFSGVIMCLSADKKNNRINARKQKSSKNFMICFVYTTVVDVV